MNIKMTLAEQFEADLGHWPHLEDSISIWLDLELTFEKHKILEAVIVQGRWASVYKPT
jgi:hypothetical protein